MMAKYALKGEGTILFQLELVGSFEAEDVLYVRGFKEFSLSLSYGWRTGVLSSCFRKGKYSFV